MPLSKTKKTSANLSSRAEKQNQTTVLLFIIAQSDYQVKGACWIIKVYTRQQFLLSQTNTLNLKDTHFCHVLISKSWLTDLRVHHYLHLYNSTCLTYRPQASTMLIWTCPVLIKCPDFPGKLWPTLHWLVFSIKKAKQPMLKASLPKRSQKKPEWLVGVHQIMFSVDLPYFSV